MMTFSDAEKEAQLRLDAESRLKSGTAPTVLDSWTVSPDALAMLYRLASSQDSAADALKLLHELQVHQVELGLQHEQMAVAEREMAEALTQYTDLYEWAPLGYFVMSRDGAVMDVNRAGVTLLGLPRDAVVGQALDWFVGTQSRGVMRDLCTALRGEGDSASCEVRFNQTGVVAHIAASVPPGGETVLMIATQQQGPSES